MNFKQLSAQARTLQKRLAQIEPSEVDPFRGCWIDSAQRRGHRYYRLRRWEGGKSVVVRSLKSVEVDTVRAKVNQAKAADRLETQLDTVRRKLERLVDRGRKMGFPVKNPLGDRDATTEWYTPPYFIDLVREVLGTIDLDPASCATAQTWIQAKTFYTKEQDGLSQPWYGRVYCNPPYGSEDVRLMAKKFLWRGIEQYQLGTIAGAIFLLNRTGAEWYCDALQSVTAICRVRKRIPFIDADGKPQKGSRNYNDFLYLGGDFERFDQVFSQVGPVEIL